MSKTEMSKQEMSKPGNPPKFGRIPGSFPKINGLHDYPISNSDYVNGVIFVGAPIARSFGDDPLVASS